MARQKTELAIGGMHCATCAVNKKKVLAGNEALSSVSVISNSLLLRRFKG